MSFLPDNWDFVLWPLAIGLILGWVLYYLLWDGEFKAPNLLFIILSAIPALLLWHFVGFGAFLIYWVVWGLRYMGFGLTFLLSWLVASLGAYFAIWVMRFFGWGSYLSLRMIVTGVFGALVFSLLAWGIADSRKKASNRKAAAAAAAAQANQQQGNTPPPPPPAQPRQSRFVRQVRVTWKRFYRSLKRRWPNIFK